VSRHLLYCIFLCNLFYCDSDSLEIVKYLSNHKTGFLFSSQELIQILDLIPSKRTQITIIEMIGPRLIDPKKCSNQLLDRFRYAEEKKIVQDILKARAVTQNSNIYASKKPNAGRNPLQRKQNRPNSPTNPHPVVVSPVTVPPPSVEIIPTTSTPSSPEPQESPPPENPKPSPLIDSPGNSKSLQDSQSNKKSESSNFEDLESVDFSPTTTNEDLENVIADKEDSQFPPRLSHELLLPEKKEIVNAQERVIPLEKNVESPLKVPEEERDKTPHTTPPQQQRMATTDTDDEFCFESPVIEVVGAKTRVLSVHQSQPASKIGSEVEFFTHTDEFSFDERFQERKDDDSNHSNPDPSSNSFSLLLHLF
jgi:hypothetical protein